MNYVGRLYHNLNVHAWIDDNHLVGTIESKYGSTYACYGWSKGGSFFLYKISEGHIEKIGTVKRTEIGLS